MKHNKLTKILFLCSLGSFVITILLEFSQRYHQILFILRHSTLYLGIAFMISAAISFFYTIYKPIFLKKKINLVYLNIPTLFILLISLLWVANTRIDFIAENEVPYYVNEILYDDYNNKIYESVLVGVKPEVEVIQKTENRLELHIEEQCDCRQKSYYIEEFYPNNKIDYYVDGSVEILVDIFILYNEDDSIDRYTIEETRFVTYKPDGLKKHYGYVSRKLVVENEYLSSRLDITQQAYYHSMMMDENQYAEVSRSHHDFTDDQPTQTIYSLYKELDESNTEIYIMNQQVEDEELNEIAIFDRKEEKDELVIHFMESPKRTSDDIVYSIQSMKSNILGNYIIEDNRITYEQSYDEANVEHGLGHHELVKRYDNEKENFTLTVNNHIIDDKNYANREINKYNDLFSSSSYIEVVNRPGGSLFWRVSQIENPFEINNISLYQVKKEQFGNVVSCYVDASPFRAYGTNENSNMMLSLESEQQLSGYFNYTLMLFQTGYKPMMIYENNEMINFIVND